MSLYRDALLAIAGWRPLERFARSRGLQLGANRFVAGEGLEDGVRVAKALSAEGKYVILDLLGEFVPDAASADAMADGIARAIEGLGAIPGTHVVSIKPTQVGLGIDSQIALKHLRTLAEVAHPLGVRLALDMEDHSRVDATLDLLETLHSEGHTHVSTVLQSYLYRSMDDLERLLARTPVPELRLVKGAYREPADVAFPKKVDVDRNYREMLERLLGGGGLVHVASHDEAILDNARARRDALGIPRDRMTFQMLYGVKPRLQAELVVAGEHVGVYTPFGADWYGYFTRRLAERPANLAFVLRGLVG